MAQGRIKGSATIVFVKPTHRMMFPILTPLIGLFVYGHQNVYLGIQFLEIIKLIGPMPNCILKHIGRSKGVVFDDKIRFRGTCRVAIKISPYQFSIPTPIIFGICCRMNTNKASTGLNIPFKCRFLLGIQYIAGSA